MNKERINRDDVRQLLSTSMAWSRKSRFMRTLMKPWQMLYPQFLKIIRKSRGFDTSTFWGGRMSVILPEDVSVNIWRYGSPEENVSQFMLELLDEGMTFVDIGAHYGFFSLLGSYLVGKEGRVLAFEPTPTTRRQLVRNVEGNAAYSNIQIFDCAAYDRNSQVKFYDYGVENSAYNSIFGSRKMQGFLQNQIEIDVLTRKADDVLKEAGVQAVDLIKIDAESSEIHVLKGLADTLLRYKPAIIIELGDFEVHGAAKSKEIIMFLHNMNYLAYELDQGKIVRHVMREQYRYCNLLFQAKS